MNFMLIAMFDNSIFIPTAWLSSQRRKHKNNITGPLRCEPIDDSTGVSPQHHTQLHFTESAKFWRKYMKLPMMFLFIAFANTNVMIW